MYDMIATVVVGYGLAGRAFHCPLIRRQPGLRLHGIVARDPEVRAQALSRTGKRTFAATLISTRLWPIRMCSLSLSRLPMTPMPTWPSRHLRQDGTAWSTRSWLSPPQKPTR